ASAAIASFDSAITTLSTAIQKVGEYQTRFAAKEENLAVAISNTESARSVIEDADFASEQMEIMKLQILQQTSLSSLAQANSQPQVVLSLFG
ncbi:MAG: flagellin, partial [Candidatus Neomarinimicrobiota bacterium]